MFFEAIDGFLPELQRPRVTASVGYVAATLLLGLCCRCDGRAWISRGRVRHHNRQLADLQRQGGGERAEGRDGEAVFRQWVGSREGVAETRPRAGLLAGQERARGGAVVGDGGAGVSGRNKVAGVYSTLRVNFLYS
ncbi:MAG: hypothetical protein KA314_29850 [Chloroflexi bacterium]|nr:hypothetical protein [Chloroflexota bacterium]MBP8060062.1 hypothetical protein [Chloroflexota bacterium]